MQRVLVTTTVAVVLTALAMSTAGCSGSPATSTPPIHAPASGRPSAVTAPGTRQAAAKQAAAKQADIYVQVLRRYLSTPGENSFPQVFKTAYVLNRAYIDAADPRGTHRRGLPITPQTQQLVTTALAGVTHVVFIANTGSVIEPTKGCWQVRNGGILIILGVPSSHGREMRIGINGAVACAGATWLTYVLRDQPGAGWRVTGTTGSMAIA
jgi:hypothetical protein